jgi:large subunit ribosomal protein L32
MTPLPKRKYAKSRQRERRAHLKAEMPSTVICPQCHNAKLSHRACPSCGYYNGREAVKVDKLKK